MRGPCVGGGAGPGASIGRSRAEIVRIVASRKERRARDARADQDPGTGRPASWLLIAVPSVGPNISKAHVATIDDPHRFKASGQLPENFGLSLSGQQSGAVDYRGRSTKGGNAILGWPLMEEALNVLLIQVRRSCAVR